MKNKKPIAILDQFVENGRTITYMTTFADQNDGRMPNSIAVFKIYPKEPVKTLKEKIFPYLHTRKVKHWASHHLIANQIHP